MNFYLRIFFFKKIKNIESRWFYEIKAPSVKSIESKLRGLMKRLMLIYKDYPVDEKGFKRYEKIQLMSEKTVLLTIKSSGKKHSDKELNYAYLAYLNWEEFSEYDLCKILDTNFYPLVAIADQEERNRIRNIAARTSFILSNGQIIKHFEPPILHHESIVLDPLSIKKKKYYTPVRFRGY